MRNKIFTTLFCTSNGDEAITTYLLGVIGRGCVRDWYVIK